MEVTISATPLTIAFFFSFFFFLSFDKPQFQFLFIYLFFLSYIFSISISIILLLKKKKKKIATILFYFSPVLASHNSFLLFFPPQHFGQLNCHNSFFFSLSPTILATPLPYFFFFLSVTILATPLPHTIPIFLSPFWALLLGRLHFGQEFR